MKSNLSKDERDGIKWLQDMAKKEKVSVVQADKGGAILLVTPELLRKKVLEKLENPQLYTKLDADPCGGHELVNRSLGLGWVPRIIDFPCCLTNHVNYYFTGKQSMFESP